MRTSDAVAAAAAAAAGDLKFKTVFFFKFINEPTNKNLPLPQECFYLPRLLLLVQPHESNKRT